MDRRRFLALSAASVLYGAPRALAAPSLLALATCDADARIAVVDVVSGRVVKSIGCEPDPRAIQSLPGTGAIVCHTATSAVSIIDGASLSLRHVLHGFQQPRYAEAHPSGRYAYVTDSGSRDVIAVDVIRGTALGRARLTEWPRHISIDPAGNTLWVGLGSASEHVAIVDVSEPAAPKFVRNIRPPFLAHDVGITLDGKHVWVTSGNDGQLAVYDRAGSVRLRLAADAAPQHVSFAGDVVYVTSGAAGTFRVQSLQDGRTLATTRVPVGSYNVQAGYGRVLTPSLDHGTLTVLDRAGKLLHEVAVSSSSHDACFVG